MNTTFLTHELKPIIVTLQGRMPEIGKIKIGGKGEKRKSKSGKDYKPPVKYDHFVITNLQRGKDDNFIQDMEIHKMLGDESGEELREIPIMLLYDNVALNFPSRLVCYKGKKLFCSGDGSRAIKENEFIKCPCERANPVEYNGNEPCKMNGVLTCMIPGVPKIGGVFKFRTTSYNTIQGITSSLSYFYNRTRGTLFNIPFKLVLSEKTGTNPKTGDSLNIRYVRIEFNGDIKELIDAAFKTKQLTIGYEERLKNIEEVHKDLITADISPEEELDVAEEYYPQDDETINNKSLGRTEKLAETISPSKGMTELKEHDSDKEQESPVSDKQTGELFPGG